MSAATTTMRVRPETRERLARISERRGLSTPELLDQLAEREEATDLLEQANAHYARLKEDSETWAPEVAERALWETTLADGLDRDS